MATNKVTITLDEKLLKRLDRLERSRLARESAKLDRALEQKLADEGLVGDAAE